jgi:drug/metabolite transporter (DMT)-like permease
MTHQYSTDKRRGELYAIVIALLESLFPIITVYILVSIEPIFAYGLSIMVSNVIFVSMILYQETWSEFLVKEAWYDLLWLTLYITTLFILMMIGLKYTTAGNVAVIISMQLFFSYLYFNLFGVEKMRATHSFGALLMGIGAIVILFPEEFTLNKGDILVFIAAMVAPLVSKHQQKARLYVSSKTILAFRNIVALPFVFGLAFYMENIPSMEDIAEVWVYIFLNGLLIFVFSKVLFVEALNLISITKLFALLSFIPLFTLVFAYFMLNEAITLVQFLGILPIIMGSYLITKE